MLKITAASVVSLSDADLNDEYVRLQREDDSTRRTYEMSLVLRETDRRRETVIQLAPMHFSRVLELARSTTVLSDERLDALEAHLEKCVEADRVVSSNGSDCTTEYIEALFAILARHDA